MKCRHCFNTLHHRFADLGSTPPSNAYVTEELLDSPEIYYPLKVFVCERCWLVQTEDHAEANQLFGQDYAYFSSISGSWLAHAAHYAMMIQNRLALNKNSMVIEIASNDGYLLKNFKALNIPCLGIEPTASTAIAAEAIGIPVLREFFTASIATKLAENGARADLLIGNNVYAHVPDINDFTAGMKILLKPNGTITLEFPHLMQLIILNQFDTIYHEHYSYLSLHTVRSIFAKHELRIFDVEEVLSHGGSLRIYACHQNDLRITEPSVNKIITKEINAGLQTLATYLNFQQKIEKTTRDLLGFLIKQKNLELKVIGYGAAAKGNTLLNYAGVTSRLLPFVCDAAPFKQGKYLPGSHIPIVPPERLYDLKPDWVLILPWNIQTEIIEQLHFIKDWNGRFVVAIPGIKFFT